MYTHPHVCSYRKGSNVVLSTKSVFADRRRRRFSARLARSLSYDDVSPSLYINSYNIYVRTITTPTIWALNDTETVQSARISVYIPTIRAKRVRWPRWVTAKFAAVFTRCSLSGFSAQTLKIISSKQRAES